MISLYKANFGHYLRLLLSLTLTYFWESTRVNSPYLNLHPPLPRSCHQFAHCIGTLLYSSLHLTISTKACLVLSAAPHHLSQPPSLRNKQMNSRALGGNALRAEPDYLTDRRRLKQLSDRKIDGTLEERSEGWLWRSPTNLRWAGEGAGCWWVAV